MPYLRCSVDTCRHNSEELCCLNNIEVNGQSAQDSEQTCCSSFHYRDGSFSNAIEQEPTDSADVDCKATHCVHNEECRCHAQSIDVDGSRANQSMETCCSTFECE